MTPHTPPDDAPRWLWPLTLAGVTLVALVIGIGAILLARGAADPPVAPRVAWTDSALAWTPGPALDPRAELWSPAPDAARLPAQDAFTLTVRARLSADSDPGAAWGLWLAGPDGSRVVYAISGDGYVTTRRCDNFTTESTENTEIKTEKEKKSFQIEKDFSFLSLTNFSSVRSVSSVVKYFFQLDDCPALRPEWRWFPYPRVNPPGQENTLTLHREPGGAIRLRINQERMGAAPAPMSGAWGVWVRGGRESGAAITWRGAEVRVAGP